jgi:hypothetical protein
VRTYTKYAEQVRYLYCPYGVVRKSEHLLAWPLVGKKTPRRSVSNLAL